jgi:hypothetical protein
MRSGGATSTHALTPSCSQRSPSLRPVEPISAMPWPRRLPRLSAHVQVCSMDQPWCTPCAVFITVSGPKGRKEAVGGVLAFSASVWPGGHWCSRYVGITPSAARTRPISGEREDTLEGRVYRRAGTPWRRPTMPLDFGIKAGAIRRAPGASPRAGGRPRLQRGSHRISFADVYTMHRSDQQSCPRSDRRTGMLTVRSWGGVRVPAKRS